MTSSTAHALPQDEDVYASLWRRFTAWRRTRPFWGGLLAMIAGVPILYFPYAHLTFGAMSIAMSTTAGAGSLIIGLLLIVLGLTAWFQPLVRVFCGVAVTILSLISIPVANLGGFGFGLITGLIAGGLLCAWAPLKVAPAVAASVVAEPAAAAVAESVVPETPESDGPTQELGATT